MAVCAGSGASVLLGVKADLLLTGEMSHHEVNDKGSSNITIIFKNCILPVLPDPYPRPSLEETVIIICHHQQLKNRNCMIYNDNLPPYRKLRNCSLEVLRYIGLTKKGGDLNILLE